MELTITSEKKQTDLHRVVIRGNLSYQERTTPSRKDVVQHVAKLKKTPEAQVIVREMKPLFGRAGSDVLVYLYEKPEHVAVYEAAYMVKRNEIKQEEATENAS